MSSGEIRRFGRRAGATLGLAALIAGLVLAVGVATRGDGDVEPAAAPSAAATTATAKGTATAKKRPARPVAVRLTGLKGFDPHGDGTERDELAAAATDRDVATYWRSERYSRFFKEGVGLLLDAGRPMRVTRLTVVSDTPGFVADVRVGSSPDGPFTPVSDTVTVGTRTTFALKGRNARYVVLWIDDMEPGEAHVNEITAQRAP